MGNQLLYKGKPVGLFQLRNNADMKVTVTNFGARIISIVVNDAFGTPNDIVLGFDAIEDYFPENNRSDFGAVIGRYANRIAGARMTIDGSEYCLPKNDGPNCLHGGPDGWQYATYDVESVSKNCIKMSLFSPDGDSGFPGNVKVGVVYSLMDDNSLRVDYHAEADKPTAINLTNHSYFNLNGIRRMGSVDNHSLMIDADGYLPVDEHKIPVGDIAPVGGTLMDFRHEAMLGDRMASDGEPVYSTGGYDHCWVLNHPGDLSRPAASVGCQSTGMIMEIFTTEPGIQVYTGNYLDGVVGKNKETYRNHDAICLETQQFPDSPNHEWRQSPGILRPEKPYDSTTIFRFKNNV